MCCSISCNAKNYRFCSLHGEHVRLPRTYRGKDIQWWLDALGILDERYDEIDDIVRGRNIPSPQLVGTPERSTLDLNSLTALGVRLRGRLVGFNDEKAQFSGSLRNVCKLADLKMQVEDAWIGVDEVVLKLDIGKCRRAWHRHEVADKYLRID